MGYERSIAFLHEFATEAVEVRDEDPGIAFTTGGCALFATAAAEYGAYAVVAIGAQFCIEDDIEDCSDYGYDFWGNPICGCMVRHFYVRTPDGWVYDIYGEHDPEALTGAGEYQHDATEVMVIREIPDGVLRCVLESWHWGLGGLDAQMAAWALELVPEVIPLGAEV